MRGGLAAFIAGLRVLLVPVLILVFVGLVAVFVVFLVGVTFLFFVGRNNRALFTLGGERDPLSIGRPTESTDGLLAAGQLKARARRDIHDPELADVEVFFPIGLANAIYDVAPVRRNLLAPDAFQAELLVDCRRVLGLGCTRRDETE